LAPGSHLDHVRADSYVPLFPGVRRASWAFTKRSRPGFILFTGFLDLQGILMA